MIGLLLVLGFWLSGEAQARERARDLLRVGAPEAEEAARMRAVLIGISDFKNLDDDEDLHHAEADAEALARVLQERSGGALADEDLHLLLGRKATYGAVRRALEQELAEAGPDDIVVIFVSSHGVLDRGEGYLLTWDTEKGARLPFTSLPTRDLDLLLQRSRARHVLLLTDACHAAISGAAGLKAGPANAINGVLASSAERAPSLFFQSSSLILQESQEGPEFCGGHGAYTCALMNALTGEADRNQDGAVTLSELAVTVPLMVMDATDGEQQPETKGWYDGALVIALPELDAVVEEVKELPALDAPLDGPILLEPDLADVNPFQFAVEDRLDAQEGAHDSFEFLTRHKAMIRKFAGGTNAERSLMRWRNLTLRGGVLTGIGATGGAMASVVYVLDDATNELFDAGLIIGLIAPLPGNTLLLLGSAGENWALRRQGVHARQWPSVAGLVVPIGVCSSLLFARDPLIIPTVTCGISILVVPIPASIVQSHINAQALSRELGWPAGRSATFTTPPSIQLGIRPTSEGPVLTVQGRF